MKAIVTDSYGPADVLKIEEQPAPEVGAGQLLVEVHATSVTTADWRFRAADFGPGMQLMGRLVAGLFRPRNRVTGRVYSGRVVAVGPGVSRFAVGDEVFGAHPEGANAERIVVPESGAVVRKPEGLTHAEAVALPFGAITAIAFLRDIAKVKAGEHVLVVGASGGVGVYVVQLAKHLGAEVTGVCSTENVELVRSLGADHVIDYTREDPRDAEQTWDVIIDCAYKTRHTDYRAKLSAHGRHAFIEGSPREMLQSLTTRLRRGPTVCFGIAADTQAAFERLVEHVSTGAIHPVIGHRFPMTDVVQAHQLVEGRRGSRGALVLDWPAAAEPGRVLPMRQAV